MESFKLLTSSLKKAVKYAILTTISGLLWMTSMQALGKPLELAASIRPITLIASDLLARAGLSSDVSVTTILPPGLTPHHMSLSVNQLSLLKKADYIFWIGEDLEPYLKSMAVERGESAISLATLKAIHWPADSGHDDHPDMHLWLDPQNGLVIAEAFVNTIGKHRPDLKPRLSEALQRYRTEVTNQIEDHQGQFNRLAHPAKPAVFHDSLNHLFSRFQLNKAFSVTEVPEQQLGMRQLLTLKKQNPACLLADVEEMEMAEGYAEKFGWPLLELDILAVKPALTSYLEYQQGLVKTVLACLSRQKTD